MPAWWHCGNAHGQFTQIVWGLFIPTIHAQPHIQLVNQVLWKSMATSDNFWENYESKKWNKSSLTKCAHILSCMMGRQESENRHDDKVKYVSCQHCWLLNLSLQDHLPWTTDLYKLRGRTRHGLLIIQHSFFCQNTYSAHINLMYQERLGDRPNANTVLSKWNCLIQ